MKTRRKVIELAPINDSEGHVAPVQAYRRVITIKTKLEILARLQVGQTPTEIGKYYDINESSVRNARRNADKIVQEGRAQGLAVPDISEVKWVKHRDPCLVKMEQLLIEWIEMHKVSLGQRDIIRDKALVFYQLIRKENNLGEGSCETLLSGHWFRAFKNKVVHERNAKKITCKTEIVQSDTETEEAPVKFNLRESTRASTKKAMLRPIVRRIRRNKNTISLDKKIEILAKLDAGEEPIDVARSYRLTEKTIRNIRRRASVVRKQERVYLAKLARAKKREDKAEASIAADEPVEILEEDEYSPDSDDPSVEKMELFLWEWIEMHRVSLESRKVVFDKAQVFYNLIRSENKLGQVANPFKPTEAWYQAFKLKYTMDNESPVEEEPAQSDNEDANSLPLQERLQTNNKSQTSPTTPNSLPKQEHSNRSMTPHNNEEDKDPDEVCLRWNSHHSNMKSSFPTLLEKEQYVDVTLCSEGQTIRCHRLILSSCSSYFDEILSGITPLQHPVIFLKGTPFWILKSLIDFMYVGEVHIEQAKLQEILEVAELLKIKGLTGKAPSQNSEPKEEAPKKTEKPTPLIPAPTTPKPPPPPRSVPPLRLAVTKEQAASMQTVDPLSLLKPSFYEESAPTKKQLIPIRPKFHHQSLAEFSAKQKEWLSKKIAPKKKLKRKSSDHDPSPPPVILRKGTKSRPIVKAPKYYHMEYEEKKEEKQVKCEEEDNPENSLAQNTTNPPSLLILPISSSTPIPSMPKLTPAPLEPTFDLLNVKSEPIDMDIEENYVEYDPPPPTSTPLIRITEPRTVSADESNVFISNPNSPVPDDEKDLEQNGVSPEEERQDATDGKEDVLNENDEETGPHATEPDPEPETESKDDKDAKV